MVQNQSIINAVKNGIVYFTLKIHYIMEVEKKSFLNLFLCKSYASKRGYKEKTTCRMVCKSLIFKK